MRVWLLGSGFAILVRVDVRLIGKVFAWMFMGVFGGFEKEETGKRNPGLVVLPILCAKGMFYKHCVIGSGKGF